jgi:hypothetical protein
MHESVIVREVQEDVQRIEHGGKIYRLSRSPDLNPCYRNISEYKKTLVYARKVDIKEEH